MRGYFATLVAEDNLQGDHGNICKVTTTLHFKVAMGTFDSSRCLMVKMSRIMVISFLR